MNIQPQSLIVRTLKAFAFSAIPISDRRNAQALRYSLWDGIFCSGMMALSDTFAIAGAVYLQIPSIAIGMIAGLPLLSGSLGQLAIANFLRPSAGRKKYVVLGTTAQSALLLLLAFTGWLPAGYRSWLYAVVFTLQGFFGTYMAGLWIAWMSSLVRPAVRGRFFARRNRIINIFQLVCGLAAGAFAFRQTAQSTSWLFFTFVFLAAGCFRFLSTIMLVKQYEPPPVLYDPGSPGSGKQDRTINSNGFLRFCFATSLMQGAVMLASPFFTVWFVRDLHFTFFTLSASTASMVLGSIVALPLWGKLSDRFGHRRVLLITGLMIAVVPLPFIFTGIPLLICCFNFYSGICWSGYNLSNFNYLLHLSDVKNPERQTSIAMAFTGISVFLFSLLGGFLASRLPMIAVWQLQSLFLLSSLLRFAVFGGLFLNLPHDGNKDASRITDFFQFARRLMDKV